MSTITNFFRKGHHYRSIYREGRFFLASEAQELQLESLEAVRNQIRSLFGDNAVVGDAFKVEVDPSSSSRLIIRAGSAFIDGYPVKLATGVDHLYKLGKSPANFDSSDFIKNNKSISDDGGISLNFGGATVVAGGTYSIVIEITEELITPEQDPMLRSANLSEDTAEKHRVVYNVHIVSASSLDDSPIPYVGSANDNLVNQVSITKSGSAYSLVSSTVITGSEQIDGRNLECIFDNGNGSTTAAFPISNDDLKEYIHGTLVDSNGTEFHITYIQVTPGNSTRITMTLDLAKTRPVAAGTNQAGPVITDSIPYAIRKKDLMYTTSSNLPEGKRYFRLADVVWDGSSFSTADIEDKRPQVLGVDGVLALIQQQGLSLYSDAIFSWNETANGGTLTWDADIKIHSALDLFEWSIPADNTYNLFASAFAQNEVLYVNLEEAISGGSLTLAKEVRGTGDLTINNIRAYKLYWLAKRPSDDRIYFPNGMILNDLQSRPFYDVPPETLLPQDILSLGYNAMFAEDFFDGTIADTGSTGTVFANSYLLEYTNRNITVAGNTITLSSNPNYTIAVGDAVVQGTDYTLITALNSPTSYDVADGSVLANGPAVIGQVLKTPNLRNVGANAKERISSYYTDTVDNILVVYDDGVVQQAGTDVRIGFSATGDNTAFTGVNLRPEALSDFNNKVNLISAGVDVRLIFFPVFTTGDGTLTLESFRAFMHDRLFVGTLLSGGGGGGGSGGTALDAPALINGQAYPLTQYKAVSVTSSGIDFADASDPTNAKGTIAIMRTTAGSGDAIDACSQGLLQNAIFGLGFVAGDEIFLGVNGDLVDAATVAGFPLGYVQKQLGFAVNATDMWISIEPLEII